MLSAAQGGKARVVWPFGAKKGLKSANKLIFKKWILKNAHMFFSFQWLQSLFGGLPLDDRFSRTRPRTFESLLRSGESGRLLGAPNARAGMLLLCLQLRVLENVVFQCVSAVFSFLHLFTISRCVCWMVCLTSGLLVEVLYLITSPLRAGERGGPKHKDFLEKVQRVLDQELYQL